MRLKIVNKNNLYLSINWKKIILKNTSQIKYQYGIIKKKNQNKGEKQ